MKNITIATINTKGQLVIPKDIRNVLKINPNVLLQITLKGQGIMIYPVEEIVRRIDSENTFSKILEITHGIWGRESYEEKKQERARRKKELTASKRRKRAW